MGMLEVMEKYNALLKGHFILTSGLHSDRYLQCALLLQHPEQAAEAGKMIAALFSDVQVDTVVGPALGGIIIAHEVGRALGKRVLFAERQEGKMTLRRGFSLATGERVLIVEDVITTGGSAKEVEELVTALGGNVVGVGSIIDRGGGKAQFNAPFRAIERMTVAAYRPEDCPLCKQGVPAYKPGSRGGK
jgi:orotate phosphoribosyltransferase